LDNPDTSNNFTEDNLKEIGNHMINAATTRRSTVIKSSQSRTADTGFDDHQSDMSSQATDSSVVAATATVCESQTR
jgi:hypothetical protein